MDYQDVDFQKLWLECYEKVYRACFSQLKYTEEKKLKIPENHRELQKIGADKIRLKVLEKGIHGLESRNWKVNIRGDNFTKLYSGITGRTHWCFLEINPAKVLYGNNIRNVRSRDLINKVFKRAFQEIEELGYTIDPDHVELSHLEANEILILDPKDINQDTVRIITDDISKGHFRTKSSLHKQSLKPNGFEIGTREKGITGYDKHLEILKKELKKRNRKLPSMKELRKLAADYMIFFRLEAKRGPESLKNILGEEGVKLSSFLENPEEVLDKVFTSTIKEAGLTEERVVEINSKKVKSLALKFKRYKKKSDRGFIVRFLKDYQSQVWGLDQLYGVVDHIGGDRKLRYKRKKSLKANYEEIKNSENKSLDAFRCLKNFIENI
ncbi:hypothetical protein PM10SUCC1_32540 [Propionigenium maris DSM 9537]|uniref:Uncharacterized protein n=1 Tax=Propionigenium maris DSM 9537 TaxID=1123000 RepID=A0A9W6LQ13_9FUSO|nr:hypothetical protein [Propionigenium maris]GLI57740.1 hypothetical protein PM10SUCC1_32540 [Propionigenium maris DSM 9537]